MINAMTEPQSQSILSSAPHVDFFIEDQQWKDVFGLNSEYVTGIVQAVLATQDLDEALQAELSIVFSNDEKVRVLNREYRGKDKATNVLSFPQDGGEVPGLYMLGDVIFAFETVEREANQQDKSFMDHLTHLLVHGVLHLLGYDHEDDKEAEEMEGLEIEILKGLGVKNPYE